ncbi:MAG: hypothetical protein KKA07_05810 [Bacteroidetes bacterium]|nr:hypothetical protein [Bacteroidota bacterium]MBU1718570.1 hypothetical protein [Bacteroidota bacterium]
MRRIFLGFSIISVLALLLILLETSCRKKINNDLIVSGIVIDTTTGAPIEGAVISISRSEISSGTYSSGYEFVTSANSDANGNFCIETEKNRSVSFLMTAFKDQYISNEVYFTSGDIDPYGNHLEIVMLSPVAFLNLRFKNTHPYNSSDFFSYGFGQESPVCADCCPPGPVVFTGNNVDQTISCTVFGNRTNIVYYKVVKNDVTHFFEDSIVCPAFSTIDHLIEY